MNSEKWHEKKVVTALEMKQRQMTTFIKETPETDQGGTAKFGHLLMDQK